ncbi:histidine phosphatase family protein [Paucibacter sp. DJ1R-11]|uniref:SixA phosphatase family protein n=1 Tax=Paucibacter sp. DJ1R-11 TaxID=2893556 RepID=UPI0021E4A264|nr:histidine phosphatase family protein [Paucibacter sp. DJ1R-11]MCV2363501.1 histidine phosphatase family protein [Paucibacter sp. DJ1R-11]
MDLILWRHAEAELLAEGGTDMARRLTVKGERQAQRMAAWLNERLPDDCLVLSSPAARTHATALALGRDLHLLPALVPDAEPQALLDAAGWPESTQQTVLLVGHQPTLGRLAARLLAGQDQAWAVKKGAVWWLRARERAGRRELTLVAVQGPDQL